MYISQHWHGFKHKGKKHCSNANKNDPEPRFQFLMETEFHTMKEGHTPINTERSTITGIVNGYFTPSSFGHDITALWWLCFLLYVCHIPAISWYSTYSKHIVLRLWTMWWTWSRIFLQALWLVDSRIIGGLIPKCSYMILNLTLSSTPLTWWLVSVCVSLSLDIIKAHYMERRILKTNKSVNHTNTLWNVDSLIHCYDEACIMHDLS